MGEGMFAGVREREMKGWVVGGEEFEDFLADGVGVGIFNV